MQLFSGAADGTHVTPRRLFRLMRSVQVVLAVAGVLLLLDGAITLGIVAIVVGVGAFCVSGTDWYREIFFARPACRREPSRPSALSRRSG
jgi:hypothetical protein